MLKIPKFEILTFLQEDGFMEKKKAKRSGLPKINYNEPDPKEGK